MNRVRGSNICYVREFLEAQRGPDAWAEVLEQLNPADRRVVEGAISAGWYDLALQHRLFVALDGFLDRAGRGGIEAFATSVTERDLKRVNRVLLRLASPALVLQKSGEYWSRFYDAGSWRTERTDNGARGELGGISEPHPIFCRFLNAYITRMFQLAGARGAQSHHTRCVCRGSTTCLFEGNWS